MDGETLSLGQESETINPALTEPTEIEEIKDLDQPDDVAAADDDTGDAEQAPEGEAPIEGEADGEVEQDAEPEFATIEVNGQEYEVPIALKDGYLRNKDYTQKRQADAEFRKTLEAREQELIQRDQISQAELQAGYQLHAVQEQLASYEGLSREDWNAMEAEDPIGAQSHWREFQLLQGQRNAAAQQLEQARHAQAQIRQSEATRRWDETVKYAKSNIKGWNDQVDAQVREHAAKELKFGKEMFEASVNPNVYKALHLAWVGSKALANQAKTAQSAAAKLKPTNRVTAKSGTSGPVDPADMSMEDYAKYASRKYKD